MADTRIVFIKHMGANARREKDLAWSRVMEWTLEKGLHAGEGPLDVALDEEELKIVQRLAHHLLEWAKMRKSSQTITPSFAEDPKGFTLASCKTRSAALLSQIYKYTKRIANFDLESGTLDRRPYDMYRVFAEIEGEEVVLKNGDDPIKIIPPHKLSPRNYYEQQFFKVPSPGRKLFEPSQGTFFNPGGFLHFIKLAADISFICKTRNTRKRKRSRSGSASTASSSNAQLAFSNAGDPYASTSVSVEMIYFAWCALAKRMNFINAAEMLEFFIYVDKKTGSLQVPVAGRCLPTAYKHKLYVGNVHENEVEVEDEDEVVNGVPLNHNQAPELIRNIPTATAEKLREFAQQFVEDINKYSTSSSVVQSAANQVARLPVMAKFLIQDGEELPDRFAYSDAHMQTVYRDVGRARIQLHTEIVDTLNSTTPSQQLAGSSQPVQASHTHTCETEEACNCDELRGNVQSVLDDWCSLLPIPFADLLKDMAMDPDNEDIVGNVQLILTDPPYNIRRERGRANSEYDSLSELDMKTTVELCSKLLRPGGHLFMFCSIEQFLIWRTLLQEHKMTPSSPPTFQVTLTPIVLVPEQGGISRAPYFRSLTHTNITEYAIHALRKISGGSMAAAMNMVSWRPHGFIQCSSPAHYNVLDAIPRPSPGELVSLRDPVGTRNPSQGGSGSGYSSGDEDDGSSENENEAQTRRLLRPEQKSLALCMELVARYSQPDDFVVDLFCGTGTTGAACISLKKARKFLGCEKDRTVCERAKIRVLNIFISNAVNGHIPDQIPVTDDLQAKMEEIVQKKKYSITGALSLSMQSTPVVPAFARLPRMQRLPPHVLHFLGGSLREPAFFDAAVVHKTPCAWSESLFATLSLASVRDIRNMAASYTKLYVSDDADNDSRTPGVYAMAAFAKGTVIGSVYGTLFYNSWADTTGGSASMYRLGAFSVKSQDFSRRRLNLLHRSSKLDGAAPTNVPVQSIHLVPARLCPLALANRRAQHYNAVHEIRSPKSVPLSSITSPELVSIIAAQNISAGAEIILSSTPTYNIK